MMKEWVTPVALWDVSSGKEGHGGPGYHTAQQAHFRPGLVGPASAGRRFQELRSMLVPAIALEGNVVPRA